MNELIVCTYCDRPSGMLDEYREQVVNAGIPFHVEYISPFPHPSGLPISFKLHWMREFAMRFRDCHRLVFTDAYDVLFVGTYEQAMERIPHDVTWGAERNCYPEQHLAAEISGQTPWRYVNAGLMAGSPEAILDWVDEALSHSRYEPNPLDQCWLNRRRADSPGLVRLDSTTNLFYVVSSTQEQGELENKFCRPWNSACDTYPCFFHFSGGCPTEGFRKLMAQD